MYSFLIYIFILFSQFGLYSIFGSALTFGGYQITTWIVYFIYVLSFLFALFYVTRLSGKYKYKMFLLAYVIVLMVTYVNSYVQDKGIMGIVSTSVHYALPILFFPTLASIGVNRKKIIKIICITSMVGAVVTLMFMSGILGKYIPKNEITTERSSLLVDGGLGLIAVAISLHLIFYEKSMMNNFYKYGTMLSGIIIIIGGQSRARLIVLIIVFMLAIIMNLIYAKQNRMAIFKVLLVLTAVAAIAFAASPALRDVSESILARFSTMGTDSSSMFRVFERNIQLQEFYNSPFFGCGWNGLKDLQIKDLWGDYSPVNNHNMYSSLLAYGGLLYTVPFAFWFIILFISELFKIGKYDTAKLHIILLIVVAILSWSSAGFAKHSQILSMIIIYADIIDREQIPQIMKKSKHRIGKIKIKI